MKRFFTSIVVLVSALLVLTACGGSNTPPQPLIFTGQGRLDASEPFTLSGGTYTITWSEHRVDSDWDANSPWHFGASIHDTSEPYSNYHLLFDAEEVPSEGEHTDRVVVGSIDRGTYVLDVAGSSSFAWTITLTP